MAASINLTARHPPQSLCRHRHILPRLDSLYSFATMSISGGAFASSSSPSAALAAPFSFSISFSVDCPGGGGGAGLFSHLSSQPDSHHWARSSSVHHGSNSQLSSHHSQYSASSCQSSSHHCHSQCPELLLFSDFSVLSVLSVFSVLSLSFSFLSSTGIDLGLITVGLGRRHQQEHHSTGWQKHGGTPYSKLKFTCS